MTIEVLSAIPLPFDEQNGSMVYLNSLAKALHSFEVRIHLAALHSAHPFKDTPIDVTYLDGNVVSSVDDEQFNSMKQRITGFFRTTLGAQKIDLVHAHHLTFPQAPALCETETTKPIIVTSHGSDILYSKDNDGFRRYIPLMAERANLITVISQELAIDLQDICGGKHGEKVRIIPPGVPNYMFSDKPKVISHDFSVLYVGKLTNNKGVDVLIRAMCLIGDVKLTIVGDGDKRGDLETLVEDLSLRSRIVFAGQQPQAAVKDYMFKSDVLVVPTRGYEGFGLIVIEGQANRTPVIASNVGGLPSAVGEGGVLVRPDDPAEIARAITQLRDQTVWSEYSVKAWNNAQNYRIEKIAKDFVNLYTHLLRS